MNKKSVGLFAIALSILWAGSVVGQPSSERVYLGNLVERPLEYVPGRVLVGFTESVSDEELAAVARDVGARVPLRARGRRLRRAFRALDVPRGRVWQVIQNLKRNPKVRYAHPDWIAHALQPPNDQFYYLQWNFTGSGSIHVEGAWALADGGHSSVVVAVLDTGIAYEDFGSFCQARDFNGTAFLPGWDFINNDAHANDDHSHGTHVAGTIAQTTNTDGYGVAGIAYETTLMPVKVLSSNGSGSISGIANGIYYAVDNGANIINMSLGTSASPIFLTALQEAVEYAYTNGVLVIAASGNSSAATPFYPAAYPEVVAVGATRFNRQIASYSNGGNEVCAPGGQSSDGTANMIVQETLNPDTKAVCDFGFWYFSGTSMASPHVAGIAALILAQDPSLAPDDVRQILSDTAEPNGDPACGAGIVNATAALEAVDVGDRPPVVNIVNPNEGEVVFGTVTIQIAASDHEDELQSVELQLNGGTWLDVTEDYNTVTGLYEVTWDTTQEAEDEYSTIAARATDGLQTTYATPAAVWVNNQNQPPVAQFTYSCNGSICDFDASGSYDLDSTITNFEWTFGDGSGGTGETVSHTYTQSGIFMVTLTLTDDLGVTGDTYQDVDIHELTNTIHVADLDRTSRNLFWGLWQAIVTIRVRDAGNSPVAGATVSGVFSDGSSIFRCTTNANGNCQVAGYQWFLNCLTFTITDVVHNTLLYQPLDNHDPDGDSDGTNITVCRPGY